VHITTDAVSSYPVSSMSCWIGRVFEEEWWGAVTSPEMTSPEMVSPETTGNNVIGSDRKLHHRKSPEMTYREWRNGKCKGDNSARLFSHRVFPAFFLRKHLGVNSESFGSFPIGHSIFPAYISTNKSLGNSTNEMPQSPFPLANHGSPYMSNESVCTIYFWPFVESRSFVQSNSNVNLCIFQFENRHFHSNIHSDRMCLSCGI
jgi:hypothetical protein